MYGRGYNVIEDIKVSGELPSLVEGNVVMLSLVKKGKYSFTFNAGTD